MPRLGSASRALGTRGQLSLFREGANAAVVCLISLGASGAAGGWRAGVLAMSKTSGFVLLAAGLAAAAYVLPWGGDTGDPDLIVPFTDATKLLPASGASEVAVVAPEPQARVEPAPPVAPIQERQPVPPFSAPVVITLS